MNQVARVFVVLNLLLAAGFLMSAATFLKQNDDWKKKNAETTTAMESLRTEKDGEISSRDEQIQALQNDISKKDGEISAKDASISDLETKLRAAEDAKGTTQNNLDRLQGLHNNLSGDVSAMKDTVGSLEALIERYKQQAIEAQAQAEEAVAQRTEANLELEGEKTKVHERENMIKALRKELNETKDTLTAYTTSYPPPSKPVTAVVDGRVERFVRDANVVTVNRGKSHSVGIGHEFDIIRDNGDFVCVVQVTKVENDYSIGHVTLRTPGRWPQAGDRATKL